MPARKAASPNKALVQDSPLLDLPPELRNRIYEEVLADTTSVFFKHGELLFSPSLASVCRQIRSEYEGMYMAEAVSHAREVNLHITDFKHSEVLPTLREIQRETGVELLSPAAGHHGAITVRLCVLLTNFFDTYLEHIRALNLGLETGERDLYGCAPRLSCQYRIMFDHRTFDVEYARWTFEKLNVALSKPPHHLARKHHWPQMERAFQEAVRRCYEERGVGKQPTGRGKKRRAATVAPSSTRTKARKVNGKA